MTARDCGCGRVSAMAKLAPSLAHRFLFLSKGECRSSSDGVAYTWFSPFGERNHAPTDMAATTTSPMKTLQLQADLCKLLMLLLHYPWGARRPEGGERQHTRWPFLSCKQEEGRRAGSVAGCFNRGLMGSSSSSSGNWLQWRLAGDAARVAELSPAPDCACLVIS